MLRYSERPASLSRIIGIDPGSSTLGIGILTIDHDTLDIVDVEGFTLFGQFLTRHDKEQQDLYGSSFVRIRKIGQLFSEVLDDYDPILAAIERPFINPRFPQAFGPLENCHYEMKRRLIEHDPTMTLKVFSPKEVKKEVFKSGTAGKMNMLRGLMEHGDIPEYCRQRVRQFDQHTVDATGVALCCYAEYRRESCLTPFLPSLLGSLLSR